MFLTWLIRILFLLVLLRVAARVIAAVVRRVLPAAPPARAQPRDLRAAPDLVRDRVCNTFISRDRALTVMVGGREEHYCSEACRDRATAAGGA